MNDITKEEINKIKQCFRNYKIKETPFFCKPLFVSFINTFLFIVAFVFMKNSLFLSFVIILVAIIYLIIAIFCDTHIKFKNETIIINELIKLKHNKNRWLFLLKEVDFSNYETKLIKYIL